MPKKLTYMTTRDGQDYKFCPKCEQEKLTTEYYTSAKSSDGFYFYCKECARVNSKNAALKDGGEKARARSRARYLQENGRVGWAGNLKRFGITPDEYEMMLAAQNEVCAICLEPEKAITRAGNPQRLAVDHDHETGQVRALLCGKCNTMIGRIETNVESLMKYFDYIATHSGKYLLKNDL